METGISLDERWIFSRHLNLDDMDFGDEGVWATLRRIVGRRGIGVFEVQRSCEVFDQSQRALNFVCT